MSATTGPPDADLSATPRRARRSRRILVVVFVVLASIGVLTSSVAVWAHRTLLDTDAWVDAVGPLASDPAVQAATADKLTTEVMQLLDSQKLLQQALPPRLEFLATPLDTAVETFVHRTVLQLVQSDEFASLWVGLNRRAHTAAIEVLRGDTRVVLTDGGDVSINLLPIIGRAVTFVGDKVPGLLDGRTVPEITYQTPPAEARAQLETALGRDLSDSFGVVFLYHADTLAAAQNALALFDRAVIALVVVTLALIVAALALSTRRRHTALQLAVGVVLAMALALGTGRAVRNLVLDSIVDPAAREATGHVIAAVLGSLDEIARTLFFLGLVLAIVAFLLGDHPWAVGVRRLAGRVGGRAASAAGGSVPSALGRHDDVDGVRGIDDQPPFPWLARNRSAVGLVGAGVAVAWLVLADITWGGLIVVLVLLALFEGAVWWLGRGRADAVEEPGAGVPGAGAPVGPVGPLT